MVSPDSAQLAQLRQLRTELEELEVGGRLDAYCLYVYGVVLRKLSLPELAVPVLCSSIRCRNKSLSDYFTLNNWHIDVSVPKLEYIC